mmetsp:Transcript_107248/g.148323  ORF Transcript_107248/g.148323 Transcript_107248/m.148323 type:complete len:107 (-) Transcript_107248:597-917(-)
MRERFNIQEARVSDDFVSKKNIQIKSLYECRFNSLRENEGIHTNVILRSLLPEKNRDTVFKAGLGAGASGSFFFFSHDKRFIIKTMTSTELKLFKDKLADPYFQYL